MRRMFSVALLVQVHGETAHTSEPGSDRRARQIVKKMSHVTFTRHHREKDDTYFANLHAAERAARSSSRYSTNSVQSINVTISPGVPRITNRAW